MVLIVVLGAAGYIGYAVASALADRGHTVHGVIRKEEYKQKLFQAEIFPVIASGADDPAVLPLLEKAPVIVDCLPMDISPNVTNRLAASQNYFDRVIKIAEKQQSKKRFIHTSGVLAYGGYPNEIIDESFPKKLDFGGRVGFENIVRNSSEHPLVDGVIARPGFVYGKRGGLFPPAFFTDNPMLHPDKNAKWSWIHISDLAEGYSLLVEAAASLVTGEDFDVVDGITRSTWEEIRRKFTQISGAKLGEFTVGNSFLDKVCSEDVVCRGEKLRRVVGWQPRHGPVLDHAQAFYVSCQSYLAEANSQNGHK